MRLSPSQSAAATKLGIRMPGNDGQEWIVVAAKNGVHRWKPIAAKSSSKKPPSAKPVGKTRAASPGKGAAKPPKTLGGHEARRAAWVRQNTRRLNHLFEERILEVRKMSRETLEGVLREQAELYAELTTQSQDLSDARIAELTTEELRDRLTYYQGEGRDVLTLCLIDVIKQFVRGK